jgi:pimeloyl-ACP methyl ester carboxylesterase
VRLGLSRRTFASAAAAVAGWSVLGGAASASAQHRPGGQQVLGSVSDAPRLPKGFANTFESRFVQANGIRQHAVVGGDGPPLLLVHGWPESWYAWRFLMPALAERFTVVAVDQRGIGLTEGPDTGYDAATLADDLAALMTELGHPRFSVVGHDTGYVIAYALAADHRDRVDRLVVAEIPGPPGVGDPEQPPAPPMFVPDFLNDRLWHIPFNRVDDELIVDMVHSNADAYYRYEYAIQGGGWTLPNYAITYYVELYTRSKAALRSSFGLYRAWDRTLHQNRDVRQATPLTIPVLGIGGENGWGADAAGGIRRAAPDVQTLVIPGTGHWVAEQAPDQMLHALQTFLSP